MATFNERVGKTREICTDDDVALVERVRHAYLWVRFEMTVRKRNKLDKKAAKLAKELNDFLDVYNLRKDIIRFETKEEK